MKMLIGAIAVLGAAAAGGAHAEELRVEHAAARVVVIPEARSSISVTVQQGDRRLPEVTVRQEGGTVVVEGGLDRRIQGCEGGVMHVQFVVPIHEYDHRSVNVAGVGLVPYAALPMITAHVPLDAKVGASGAVWGQVGATNSLTLSNVGCGDWSFGDVRGPLVAAQVGSGDFRGGNAPTLHSSISGSADLFLKTVGGLADTSVSGSGDVHIDHVNGPLHAGVGGSGNVTVQSVSGPIVARIGGSGDVKIAGGRATQLSVDVAGSGDFTFAGTADAVTATVAGSGDVHIAHATGPVSKRVAGSGEVSIGR
ncbi:MAG: GIN domain-containing protein [Caulobacteraceae bacterium]